MKKNCLSRSISQEPDIIYFSFMVYMYKMMTSPDGFFHFFLILVFQVKGQKMAQSDKKVCCTAYLRNLTSYDCRLWYSGVEWWYVPVPFLYFFKILIFQVVSGDSYNWQMHQEMHTLADAFFIFSKFWFSGLLGG